MMLRAAVMLSHVVTCSVGLGAPVRSVPLPDYAAHPGELIDVGGYRLNLYCFGQGEPTVLFLSGGAWGAVAWAELQPALATTTRVCSYDRAGMNFSDLGPIARAPDHDLRDLSALIEKAHIKTPVVLAGWSAGGMLARWYADVEPGKVAAIVTIDGSDFDYWDGADESAWLPGAIRLFRECKKLADSGAFETDRAAFERCSGYGNPLTLFPALRTTLEQRLHNPALYSQWLHDLEHEGKGAAALRKARRSYGSMPLRVIVAGTHFRPAAAHTGARPALADVAFIQHSYQILDLSSDSELLVAPNTSHAIHFDRPDFVTAVIADVIGKVRSVSKRP